MKKLTVINTLNELPKKFDLEEFLERLIVVQKIDEGLEDEKSGKTISHDKVKKWLLNGTNKLDEKIIEDLKAINDYIFLDSTFYATRFIHKLITRVDQLIELNFLNLDELFLKKTTWKFAN